VFDLRLWECPRFQYCCASLHIGVFVDAATSPIPLNVFHTKISKCALVAQGHEDPLKTFNHVSHAKMSSNKQLYH
jgi:hypothetical protein